MRFSGFALFLFLIGTFMPVYGQALPDTSFAVGLQDTTRGGNIDIRRLLPWSFSYEQPDVIQNRINLKNRVPIDLLNFSEIKQSPRWKKYGWFEAEMVVDSTLAGIPFHITFHTQGAAKIWINGKLVLEAGHPSMRPEEEVLARYVNPHYAGITLAEGRNVFLVEYSEHTVPRLLGPINLYPDGLDIRLYTKYSPSLRRLRGVVFGGVVMLLLLLVLIHSYLGFTFKAGYHIFVSLTTLFILLHAFTTLSDTVVDWTFRYRYFYAFSYATSFAFVIYFYLISIRLFYNLDVHWKTLTSGLVFILVLAVYSVLAKPELINVINPALGIPTLLYGAYALWQAKKMERDNSIFVITLGFIVTVSGALLYAFVYLVLGINSTILLLVAATLAYTGMPISLTFNVAQSYAKLIATLEQKVQDRTAELEASNAFKSRFFANISHEFRTPLTISEGLVNKVVSTHENDAFVQKELGVVARNLRRLHNMVDQVIDLTKSDESQIVLNKKRYKADELVAVSVESFRSMAEYRNLQFSFDPNGAETVLWVDRAKVEIMVNNLISNAIKFTPNGGAVSVRTVASPDRYLVTVQDTGPGIPAGEEDAIFERFYRIHRAEEDYVEGMGVGLELSRTLARLHDGDISVEPNRAEGALFRLHLPVEPEAHRTAPEVLERTEPAAPAVLARPVSSEQKTGYTILLVEDNRDMTHYVSEILSELGVVHKASNGEEALDLLQSVNPDLIITDLMMPKMGGQKLVEHLAADKKWRKIPVVVLTAKALEDDKLNLLRIGVVDYITKPFQPEQLLLKTRNLLAFYDQRVKLEVAVAAEELLQVEGLKEQVAAFITQHITDANLTVERLADEFAQSRRSFYRNIQLDTGMTPAQFIREVRLSVAREIAATQKKISLEALAHAVGYKSTTGFRRAYEQRFGEHPIKESSVQA